MDVPRNEEGIQRLQYWSGCWERALNNMPRKSEGRSGRATLLHILLGYPHLGPKGKNWAAVHYYTSVIRGTKPRDPDRQRLLEILAGPHGTTYVRAIALLKNIDLSKYKYWPHQ